MPATSPLAPPLAPAGAGFEHACCQVVARPGASPSVALTYGTFDLFHIGHLRLFERIKQRLHELARTLAVDDGS